MTKKPIFKHRLLKPWMLKSAQNTSHQPPNKPESTVLSGSQKSNSKRIALLLGSLLCAVLLKRDSNQAPTQDQPKSKK